MRFSALLLILTWISPLCAENLNKGTEIQVTLSQGPKDSHRVEGHFTLECSSQTAWEVLGDYDHLTKFVSSIKSSKKVRQENGHWVVEQIMTGKTGFFRKRIYLLLEIKEVPLQTIAFHDVSKKSFKSYAGKWSLSSVGNNTSVTYELEAVPAFYSPDFLTMRVFKKNVKILLEEVREEMRRRTSTH
ncbi:MAG: hypothetical protein KCHDKBKB_01374 [Elusimicrobia bacterium]|nr:hypothetical protein [Elusimicrobiota bacterium]